MIDCSNIAYSHPNIGSDWLNLSGVLAIGSVVLPESFCARPSSSATYADQSGTRGFLFVLRKNLRSNHFPPKCRDRAGAAPPGRIASQFVQYQTIRKLFNSVVQAQKGISRRGLFFSLVLQPVLVSFFPTPVSRCAALSLRLVFITGESEKCFWIGQFKTVGKVRPGRRAWGGSVFTTVRPAGPAERLGGYDPLAIAFAWLLAAGNCRGAGKSARGGL